MWTAERITEDAAEKMQIGAGLLLSSFDVTNPVEPAESDIICDTTGDYSISCVPETSDLFEDVNNAFTGSMEGKRIDSWSCSLSIESLTFSDEVLKLALGAADVSAVDGGVNPRRQYKLADFAELYWIGDMLDEDKLLVVAMDHAVSTGGLSLTTTNKGKGRIALEITPHSSLYDQQKIPMAFYILSKVDEAAPEYVYTAVEPVGSENPKNEGWYVLVGDVYRPTTDTEVDENVTYYERTEAD